MKRFVIIVKSTIIVIICLYFMGYVIKHYDGKEYGFNQINDYVTKMCKVADTPGMSVAVLNDEQEYYINAGYENKDTKTKATSETKYELGSTTKAFTALGILLLEQDGMLDRNDSVSKYIPWFAPSFNGGTVEMTIEQLLCHTSGIPAWTIANLPIGTINDDGLLEETISMIKDMKLDNHPGKVYNYATINYDVLALIIERVTNTTYEEYIEKSILEPLGMYNSYFRVDNSKKSQLAQGYHYAFQVAEKYEAPTFYGNTAAGYLVSNTKDLMIWMKAQSGLFEINMTESLEKIKNAIMESHLYPIKSGKHYWAGWNLYHSYFFHTGNNPNFSSHVIIDRDETKAVFALTNISGSAAAVTADGIYRILHGENIKIGFFVDETSLVDLFCTILCFVELYVGIILWEKKNRIRTYAIVKASISLLLAILIAVFPYALHYNYLTLAIWYSPSLLVAAVGGVICLLRYAVKCAV
ncbi:serine hydrolase domain-containing protein [Anaerosacchariphilus polymeriproducens]|uniref:Class A beta-lactamase-related serine hydrolase n=1 Tax=Anaerosacchariphilus polymeriproducens TaxID=1812858 RepID=A0A371AUK1_9FIRM|nr:serine hydrolase domain-containing protein [Anaerosacchariphilus polymeriproducens]RDU23219.1 class A beta-lactamase-related serine hydrolase [Anaerosacchariphilus polymeriproducens]